MDIVYIIGGDLNNDNNLSLRYSLRSIAQNGLNVNRVIVAGPKLPDWLSNEVVKFEVSQDPYTLKTMRIFSTVLAVNDNFKFPKCGFLISMDDHFYLRPVNFDCYPMFNKDYPKRDYRNRLPKKIDPSWVSSDYAQILKDTGDWLRSHNYPDYTLTIHRNIHMFPQTIKNHRKEINELMKSNIDIEMINVVLDMYIADNYNTAKLVTIPDFKTCNPDKFKRLVNIVPCVSTSDFEKGSRIHQVLDSIFPNKCKYEK